LILTDTLFYVNVSMTHNLAFFSAVFTLVKGFVADFALFWRFSWHNGSIRVYYWHKL